MQQRFIHSAALEAFHDFRIEAGKMKFRCFLEVFTPNVNPGFDPKEVGAFLNDNIIRCLAGVTTAEVVAARLRRQTTDREYGGWPFQAVTGDFGSTCRAESSSFERQ
ncbi:MAG: hypothetical protein WD708_01665 [Kiritimatiellia bacterium]